MVSRVELSGADGSVLSALRDGLATAESPKFLGLFDGVAFEYEWYDEEKLEKDIERIERYLNAKGYYGGRVKAARVVQLDSQRIRVELELDQGVAVLVEQIAILGTSRLPNELSRRLLADLPLKGGALFTEQDLDSTKQLLLRRLRVASYAHASVTADVVVDIARHSAHVKLSVQPGPSCQFGAVVIHGLKTLPEQPVRAALALVPGEQYSEETLEAARRALVGLAVFSSIQVIPERSGKDPTVPVAIVLQESKARTIRIGAGLELNALELSNHVTFGWEHNNFFGGLRRFSTQFRPGLVYYPTRFSNLTTPNRTLVEGSLSSTLRQPNFIEHRTTLTISGRLSVAPELFSDSQPDDPLVGFAQVNTTVGLEREFFQGQLLLTPSFNWQLALPLDYRALTLGSAPAAAIETADTVNVTYPELGIFLDLRSDPFSPRRGIFAGATIQFASQTFGGGVSDWRLNPELRTYLPISRSIVFATRFAAGFLFPRNYDESTPEILLVRGFFSGGATTNRGYPLRGISPRGVVRFLNPEGRCSSSSTDEECQSALGGRTLWESSFEIRYKSNSPLGLVWFADMSDVNPDSTFEFNSPHLSLGMGLRYSTPVGPVRFDVGWRPPFAQESSSEAVRSDTSTLLGLPIAAHLTLGESF